MINSSEDIIKKHIPKFTDISNWEIDYQYNTKGSRSKEIVSHPESGDLYFYKASKVDKFRKIRYSFEFWSEIVSSKVGQILGFNILDYNIAYDKRNSQPVGCISKSMINFEENKLTEGISYLTGFDADYNPEEDQDKYTFQFIEKALANFKLDRYLPNIIEMLVFDALVSNSDRHQENWAFITLYQKLTDSLEEKPNIEKDLSWLQRFKKYLFPAMSNYSTLNKIISSISSQFSPIYDSGCCLGREVTEEKIAQFLKDKQALDAYIRKGSSEVHWEGINKKPNHYLLLKKLMPKYGDTIRQSIIRCSDCFDELLIAQIINNIDSNLPNDLLIHKLPDNRKELMIKILTLRLQKLKEII